MLRVFDLVWFAFRSKNARALQRDSLESIMCTRAPPRPRGCVLRLRPSFAPPVARGRATLRRHRLFHTMRRRRGPRSAPELLPPARISHSLAPARRHPARSAPRPPPAGGCRRPHGSEPRPSPLGYRPRPPAAPPPPLGFARCLRLCLPEPHIAEQSS